MKKFQFRLQKLLWYHQQRQKQAEVRLRQAFMERDAALTERGKVEQEIERTCQLHEQPGGLINVSMRQNVAAHLQLLSRTLTAAEENLKLMDQRLREANEALTEVTKDVEGLLHLRAQQLQEHRDEVNRQQQIVLDEVVMRQWSMRDADATASP